LKLDKRPGVARGFFFKINLKFKKKYRASQKKLICGAWCKIVSFFVQLSCMVFFTFFVENLQFFWYFNGPKENPRIFFSLKIKSSEKQKCVFILFLFKSKILLRLNHRITENWKNCNKKIRNFQFWSNFYGKVI